MNEKLARYCDLLAKNREAISHAFAWDMQILQTACAAMFAGEGRTADVQILKECQALLKEHAGIFSDFRGHLQLPILAKMAMSTAPGKYYEDLHTIYSQFTRNKVFGTEYRLLASMIILDHVGVARAAECIDRMYEIYDGMSERHALLTSSEDLPLAAMLAAENVDPEILLDEMELCYTLLTNRKFSIGNAAQTCSHTLALSPLDAAEKCTKLIEVWDCLKASGHKFGTGFELAILGVLSTMQIPTETIVEDICDADEFLKQKKGFGMFGLGTEYRRMFAAQMVIHAHAADRVGEDAAMISSSIALSIAIEICLMIVIVTSVAATSSHNS